MQFLDPNNPLLASGPARLDAGIITHPVQGKIAMATVRTQSTTVTVALSADDIGNWVEMLQGLQAALGGGSKLQAANMGDVAALNSLRKLDGS